MSRRFWALPPLWVGSQILARRYFREYIQTYRRFSACAPERICHCPFMKDLHRSSLSQVLFCEQMLLKSWSCLTSWQWQWLWHCFVELYFWMKRKPECAGRLTARKQRLRSLSPQTGNHGGGAGGRAWPAAPRRSPCGWWARRTRNGIFAASPLHEEPRCWV